MLDGLDSGRTARRPRSVPEKFVGWLPRRVSERGRSNHCMVENTRGSGSKKQTRWSNHRFYAFFCSFVQGSVACWGVAPSSRPLGCPSAATVVHATSWRAAFGALFPVHRHWLLPGCIALRASLRGTEDFERSAV